jgi:hypothetical protein
MNVFDLTWVEQLLQPHYNLDLLIFPLLVKLFLHYGFLDIEYVSVLGTIGSHSLRVLIIVGVIASIRHLRATSHRLRVFLGSSHHLDSYLWV